MVLAVVPYPVGGEVVELGHGCGQVVLRQAQAFPKLHVDAIAGAAHAHGHAVELAVHHEGLDHFGVHGRHLFHNVRVLAQVRAVALFNQAFHGHVGQAHQQHVVRAGIGHHGLGELFNVAGIVPAHVHGDFGVASHEGVVRVAAKFAENGQRAVFNALRVQLEHPQPLIAADEDIVAVHIKGLPSVGNHAAAGIGAHALLAAGNVQARYAGAVQIVQRAVAHTDAVGGIAAQSIIGGQIRRGGDCVLLGIKEAVLRGLGQVRLRSDGVQG